MKTPADNKTIRIGGASGFWEDQIPCDMVSVRLAPSLISSTAEALALPADRALERPAAARAEPAALVTKLAS